MTPAHGARRGVIFDVVCDVLRAEKREWADALKARPGAHESFDWVYGVRCAAEVAIGYLTVKRLVTCGLVDGFVWPEFSVDGGRVDLWVGDAETEPGLGVELKFVMSGTQAGTIESQARRLCSSPRIDAAAFIVWSHHPTETTPDEARIKFPSPVPGWTAWRRTASSSFDARYKVRDREAESWWCHVELWSSDRVT